MHGALRTCHSLAMHFAMFTGSNVEVFDPIVELKWAKHEMGGPGEGEGKAIRAQTVGNRWMEGGHRTVAFDLCMRHQCATAAPRQGHCAIAGSR
jgi:hypothetical protein